MSLVTLVSKKFYQDKAINNRKCHLCGVIIAKGYNHLRVRNGSFPFNLCEFCLKEFSEDISKKNDIIRAKEKLNLIPKKEVK